MTSHIRQHRTVVAEILLVIMEVFIAGYIHRSVSAIKICMNFFAGLLAVAFVQFLFENV